jgi:phosphoglycerate dehydrogenase-like enzyme
MHVDPRIVFWDEDHLVRMALYAAGGPGHVAPEWFRATFSPETVDLEEVYHLGDGLHAEDGFEIVPPPADSHRVARDATILIFRRGAITAEVMDANPRLRLIQRIGERATTVDLAAAAKRSITVACIPRPTVHAVAEHVIMLMLALSKKLLTADRLVRAGGWDASRVQPIDHTAYNWAGISGIGGLFGRTLGIIGLGEIGTVVAQIAVSFGMTVEYVNRRRLSTEDERRLGLRFTDVESLLSSSDFISLHAQNVAGNQGMLDASAWERVKPGAIFVNTSRGRLVNEDALYDALQSGRLGGAGLDVHSIEPRPAGDRFAGLSNVIMTPHCAAGSRQAIKHELRLLYDSCRAFLAGQAVPGRVG